MGPGRKCGMTFSIGTRLLAPKRVYTPPGTLHQLYFNDDGILVLFVDGGFPEVASTAADFRLRFPSSRETGRLVGTYELQADLSSCVTLIGVFRSMNDALESAAFGYVCPPKKDQMLP